MPQETNNKCCAECSRHDSFCIPSCYPEHCHNPVCNCHKKYITVKPDDFKDLKFEVDVKIQPSPRIDYCSRCKKDHGYDCPLDTPPLNIDAEFDKREELRMNIVRTLEDVSGDIWCDCDAVNEVINKSFDSLLHEVIQREREELKKKVEGM